MQELRLRTFQCVDLFLACMLKVALNCFGNPFAVTDALARVIFLFGIEPRRLFFLNPIKENPMMQNSIFGRGWEEKHMECTDKFKYIPLTLRNYVFTDIDGGERCRDVLDLV